MPESFIRETLEASRSFAWIKRIDSKTIGKVAKARLWLNDEFVEVYYNAQTNSISFAYIHGEQRVFGANNMGIGWHVHPFGQVDFHEPSLPLSITEFLQALEKELRQRGKLP
jgi:hypothetical protein